MKQEDIIPEEEIIPSNIMWYQRRGCVVGLIIIFLLVGLGGIFAWQVNKYYQAITTGQITPEMKEMLGDVLSEETVSDIVTADDDPFLGPEDAKVTVIAFEDFQCTVCGQAYPDFKRAMIKYQDRVKFVYRDYPTTYEFSQVAAEAGECAHEQELFWPYHDLLFSSQDFLTDTSAFTELAKQAGLEEEQFTECFNSSKYKNEVNKDFLDGSLAGAQGTPTYFINGYKLEGAYPYEFWEQSFDYLLESLADSE